MGAHGRLSMLAHPSAMNVQFCDLCNESIPLADLDSGRAVRRNERLICAACEGAMSGHHARPEGAGLPLAGVPVPSAAPSAGSAVPAVALSFASVALVVAVGGCAYFLWQMEDFGQSAQAELERLERSLPEQTRSASAELLELVRRSEERVTDAQRELVDLGRRLDALERGVVDSGDLERRIERVEERQALLSDLASRVDHQAALLAELELALAEAGGAAAPASAASGPARTATETPVPVAAAPAAATEETKPTWEPLVAELTSPTGSTRWQAVQALGKTGDARVVPHLLPLLDDTDLFVRMAVARLLGDLGSMKAIPGLIETLEDEEVSVRESALVSLRKLSGQSIPFDPKARDGERAKRIKDWREWWEKAEKELLGAR